jgi:hypothetical protein
LFTIDKAVTGHANTQSPQAVQSSGNLITAFLWNRSVSRVIILFGQADTHRPQPLQIFTLTCGATDIVWLQTQIHLFPGESWFWLLAVKGVIAGALGNNSIAGLLAGAAT